MPDPAAVNSLFGRIAPRYDAANRILSGGADIWWRRRLVRAVRSRRPGRIVDLATGSGDVAFALRRALPEPVEILGLDFCEPMLEAARAKQARDPQLAGVSFQLGDCLQIPLPDGRADAVTIAFGLRNTADRGLALAEMRRILSKPCGRLYVLEFSQPDRCFRPVYFFYLKHLLPRIAARVTGDKAAYDYLAGSIHEFPSRASLAAEIRAAGFRTVSHSGLTLGIVALHEAEA